MRRNPMLHCAVFLLVVVLLLLAGGAPSEAGALAGVSGSGPGAAAGLAWIVVFPLAVVMVPPLLFAATVEGLHGLWGARARSGSRPGLAAGPRPGDTRRSDRGSDADRAV